ncbi:Protein of unknown function, partial [Gryllus bimaculatus]
MRGHTRSERNMKSLSSGASADFHLLCFCQRTESLPRVLLQVGSSVSSTTSKILETLRTAETPLVEEESGVSLTDGLMSSEASSQTGGEERGRAAPAVGVVRLRDLLLGEREVQAPVARSSSPRRRPALAARSSARTAPLPHGGR